MGLGKILQNIYGQDFSEVKNAEELKEVFFAKVLRIAELKQIHDELQKCSVEIDGQEIKAALHLKGDSRLRGNDKNLPFIILAQMHGNEPAGLAGIALAAALSEADLLKHDVFCVIGNPLASAQYFAAWESAPNAAQETRDCYRCGLAENGELLPDGNRIPVNFLTVAEETAHIKRSRELYKLAQNSCGTLDIHSARGNMTCITEHKSDAHLKYSPIRAVLTDLSEAISANASTNATVQTLKTIVEKLPNIGCQTGIEAGRHEAPESPRVAAEFTLATLYNTKVSDVKPLMAEDNGKFMRYSVRPRITYADLAYDGAPMADDKIYMVQEIAGKTEEYQYDEMEAIRKGQVVAVTKPSGVVLRAPSDFSGIFFSKSATLYDKDPAVGPWPVAAEKIASVKFCYPCVVSEMVLDFK